MKIRPVTDLRNHFPEVEAQVKEEGAVYLTKNGYATAVLVDVEKYEAMKRDMEPSREFKKKRPSHRGYMHKYANPELIPFEKDAGRLHVMKNYKKYLPEGRVEE